MDSRCLEIKKMIGFSFIGLILLLGSVYTTFTIFREDLFIHYYKTDKEMKIGFFTLHYKEEDEAKAQQLKDAYSSIDTLQKSWFKVNQSVLEDLDLFVYLSSSSTTEEDGHDIGGLYLPQFKVLFIKRDLVGQDLLNTFSHELSHVYLSQSIESNHVSMEDIPNWFHEGVAMSFAQKAFPILLTNPISDVKPLMEIEETETKDGKSAYYAEEYTLMMYAIEYLIHQKGEKIILNLVEETKKSNDFTQAFETTTNIQMDTYHTYFETNMDPIREFEKLLNENQDELAKEKMMEYIETRGYYFDEAPLIYNYLVDLYLKEKNYERALIFQEKQLEYQDQPPIFQKASEIAAFIDKQQSIEYAEAAVVSAKKYEWDVSIYEEFLSDQMASME